MKLSILISVLCLGVVSTVSIDDESARPVVGLSGSKHDFTHQEWTGGDLCIACHGQKSELPEEAPLWNPSADFDRTFADALQKSRKQIFESAGNGSLICMRCHDGTMASDMFGGLTEPRSVNEFHPALSESSHGGTNHPVGVEYPPFDREFRPANAILSEGKVRLPGGKVECISCHDPHNELGARHMLTKDNHRSALCLTCHRK